MSWDWILGFTPLSGLILATVEAESLVLATGAFCLFCLAALVFLFLFGSPRGRRIYLVLVLGMFPVQVLFLEVPAGLAALHMAVLGSTAGLLWTMMRRIDGEKALLLEFVRRVNGAGNFEEASALAVRFVRDEFRYPTAAVFLATTATSVPPVADVLQYAASMPSSQVRRIESTRLHARAVPTACMCVP